MTERLFTDAEGNLRMDLRPADASSATRDGVDPALVERLMRQVELDGYVIIPDLLPRSTLAEIKSQARPHLTHTGRNEIEGHKTRRIYSVIEKTLSCNPMVEHPLILALLDRVLAANYLLSQLQVIEVLPGEVRQPLHFDDGFYPFPRPRPAFSAATIWAIDDFTADNGATLVLPKSHLWGDESPETFDASARVPAVMPAGSVIFFLGTLWHGAGANHTDAPRMAATAQYCEPWARQQENYSLAISRERAKQCSPAVQGMLGYSMHFPFIGFVNGRDPMHLLK